MSNIVYALVNPAMPGLVKIGKTTRDNPEVRMNELYSTGVPLPFECAIAIQLEETQADGLEKALHTAFRPNRLNPSREFFEIDPEQVEAILKQFPGKNVTPGINEEIEKLDAGSREAVKEVKKRRPKLHFVTMGIPIGSTLTSTKAGEEITVTGEQKVSCRGEEMSLTRATQIVRELADDSAPNPTEYWLFNGRELWKIYKETYGERA